MDEHPGLYRLLLTADRSLGFLDRTFEVRAAGLLEAYEPRPEASVPADIAADHVIAAFLNLIRWWLDHDMPHPPSRMGLIYRDLILALAEAGALRPRT